jgi:hypothetical protein
MKTTAQLCIIALFLALVVALHVFEFDRATETTTPWAYYSQFRLWLEEEDPFALKNGLGPDASDCPQPNHDSVYMCEDDTTTTHVAVVAPTTILCDGICHYANDCVAESAGYIVNSQNCLAFTQSDNQDRATE